MAKSLVPPPQAIRSPSDLLESLTGAGAKFDTEQVLEQIIDLFGGPRQFAVDLKQEYDAAEAGSVARQRLFAMIGNMLERSSAIQQERGNALEEMATEDLEGVLREYAQSRFLDVCPHCGKKLNANP